jgi:hypothetical protein
VTQQHSLVFGRKKVVWTWKHGPELPIYKKDYHPEKTADKGGSAEKSQGATDIRLYSLTLKGS